jgi:hypothetical protein
MSIVDRALAKIDQIRKQNNYRHGNSPANMARVDPSSLLFYYGNIHSQRGQDGILAEIFRRLGMKNGFFVEFGAWDGNYLCNSRRLYEIGWSGFFIEGDATRYRKLVENFGHIDGIFHENAFVGSPEYGLPGQSLREIMLARNLDPGNVDFLSIDIDGFDLEVFLGCGVKPKVALIEGGFNFSPCLKSPVSDEAIRSGLQHHVAHIAAAVEKHGYKVVCFYQDCFLVRSDLADQVDGQTRSPLSLFSDAYYFMPDEFREALLNLRANNSVIQSVETAEFGFFRKNPIDPDYFSA